MALPLSMSIMNKSLKTPITIVIPTYNEEKRLPPTLDEILLWRKSSEYDAKILVVDDGSSDTTCEIVERYASYNDGIILVKERHVGYMSAIISGLKKAPTDISVTIEADMPVHPKVLDSHTADVSNYDLIVGTRLSKESKLDGKSIFRRKISSAYSVLFRILFRVPCRDPQIGFKVYRSKVLKHVLPLLQLSDDGLKSSEFVIKAFGLGYSILEIPVDYKHDPDSRLMPKGKSVAKVVEATRALFSLWLQTARESEENLFQVNPIRGSYVLPFLGLATLKKGTLFNSEKK
jgi:dolichyl-phosphate beta-glucosyltransferase